MIEPPLIYRAATGDVRDAIASSTGVIEHDAAVFRLDVLNQLDASMRPRSGLASAAWRLERLLAQVGAVELEEVEAEKLHLAVVAA